MPQLSGCVEAQPPYRHVRRVSRGNCCRFPHPWHETPAIGGQADFPFRVGCAQFRQQRVGGSQRIGVEQAQR